MSSEIVPFGKYKGQPVEAVAADAGYCEWLIAQPWFQQRYGNVYNILIQGGAEPQDSPEHNQMQARFLDDELCFRLAELLRPDRVGKYDLPSARRLLEASPRYQALSEYCELQECEPTIRARRFESRGWDVVYQVRPASVRAHPNLLPPCTCQCDHAGCPDTSSCNGGRDKWLCSHSGHNRSISGSHCTSSCHWAVRKLSIDEERWISGGGDFFASHCSDSIQVELKPDLGDDYPSVLRQVTQYPSYLWEDVRCVVARRHAFQHVTWDQVRQIFAASEITLLAESDLR